MNREKGQMSWKMYEHKILHIDMKRINIIILLFAFAMNIAAQKVYTLQECKQIALDSSNVIKNAKLEIESASQTGKYAFTKYFPSVNAAGISFGADDYTVKIPVNVDQSTMTQIAAALSNAGLGGMVAPLASMIPDQVGVVKHGEAAVVSAVQPVFAGGRIVNSNRLAKVGKEVSKNQFEIAKNTAMETTEKFYWLIVSLKQKRKTVESVKKMLDRIYSDVSVAKNAGVATGNDLLKVELQQQKVKSAEIKINNGILITKMALSQYIGINSTTDFDVSDSGICNVLPPEKYYISPETGLLNRTEYALLDNSVKAAKIKKHLEIGKNLPSVGVGASYAYHNVTGADCNFGMVFATVKVPVSDWWGGSHNIKKMAIKQREAENNKSDKDRLLLVDIQQKWSNLLEAYSQIEVAKKSVASSEENLKYNEDYYNAGTVPLSDLLDAQTLYRQSMDQYTDAYTSYRYQVTKYLQSTGR